MKIDSLETLSRQTLRQGWVVHDVDDREVTIAQGYEDLVGGSHFREWAMAWRSSLSNTVARRGRWLDSDDVLKTLFIHKKVVETACPKKGFVETHLGYSVHESWSRETLGEAVLLRTNRYEFYMLVGREQVRFVRVHRPPFTSVRSRYVPPEKYSSLFPLQQVVQHYWGSHGFAWDEVEAIGIIKAMYRIRAEE